MTKENLYFIAVVPPVALQEEIRQIQQEISDRFQTLAALKVVPHITLKAPITSPDFAHQLVCDWFVKLKLTTQKFKIELKDFSVFDNPKRPVIYINPLHPATLIDLQHQIIAQFESTFPAQLIMDIERNFRPHLTVAYRDLSPELFRQAWDEFRNRRFTASFDADQIFLLQHNGSQWNKIREYALAEGLS